MTRPVPKTPQELVGHDCINHRQFRSGGLHGWEFEKDGRELRVRVEGQLIFGASYAMIDAVVNGYGIAYISENLVERELVSGKLLQVLDDWSPVFSGYYLYYSGRRQNFQAFKVVENAPISCLRPLEKAKKSKGGRPTTHILDPVIPGLWMVQSRTNPFV